MNLTRLNWIKNVTDPRGIWAYKFDANQEEFGLNWSTGSEENAKKLQRGELILLKQRGKITHLVRVIDDGVQKDSNADNIDYKPYRSVEIVWVTSDWENSPTVEQVFKHKINLQGGYAVSLENIEVFRQYWNESRGGLSGFQDHIQKLFFDTENNASSSKKLELTVEYIFDLFTYHLGHKVIQKRQNRWRNSPEGWDHHALIHLWYWTLRDFKGFTHGQAGKELAGTDEELLERLMSELFAVLQESKRTGQNQQEIPSEVKTSTPPDRNNFEESLRSLIEEQYGETVQLLGYNFIEKGASGLFLEPRRNWLFDFILDSDQNKFIYRPIEMIHSLTDEKLEGILPKLNKLELQALVALVNLSKNFGGTVTILDASDFTDSDKSLETYGFYPSSEDILPMLFYNNKIFGVGVGTYLYWGSEEESLSESMVMDDPVDSVNVFKHPQEAIQYAIARLSYYIQES